jgi:hypothetical protein
MSQVKKQYQDWCEKQDKQPEDFGDAHWTKEFEQWLDDFAKECFRDEGEA